MDDGFLSGNFHGKKSPAFCIKHVELGAFNSPLVLKRVVFVCFCRLSGSRISVLNRMAWISVWLLLNKKHQSLNFGMSPKMTGACLLWISSRVGCFFAKTMMNVKMPGRKSMDTAPFWWDSLASWESWAVMVARMISSKLQKCILKIQRIQMEDRRKNRNSIFLQQIFTGAIFLFHLLDEMSFVKVCSYLISRKTAQTSTAIPNSLMFKSSLLIQFLLPFSYPPETHMTLLENHHV